MEEQERISQFPGESKEDVVIVGTSGKSIPVSFQELQDIYNELTGKTEEVENSYKIKYKIKLEDIEQLYIKIQQAFEQYNVKSNNSSVTVFFVKGTKEVFSSFERFKLFNSSTRKETERIYMNLNFMIVLPKTKRVQQYEIEVKLSSSIGVKKKVHEDMGGSGGLFRFFIGYTAQISIKYVDYLVARNFLDIIDEWIKCLTDNKKTKYYDIFSKYSHFIPIFIKNILFILSLYLVWVKFPYFIPPGTSDLYVFSNFFILAAPFLYLSLSFGWTIGKFIERSIDEYQFISYICLTRGDEILIEEVAIKNKKKVIMAILGIIISFISGILASVIANKITM